MYASTTALLVSTALIFIGLYLFKWINRDREFSSGFEKFLTACLAGCGAVLGLCFSLIVLLVVDKDWALEYWGRKNG